MTKRFQQNQRDKLKEHFKNHIFYRLCREVRDVFLQQNYKGLCMKVFIKCGNVITSQPVLQ